MPPRKHPPPPDAAPAPAAEPGFTIPPLDLTPLDEPPPRADFQSDIFAPEPIRLQKLAEKGIDTQITRVRIQKWQGTKRVKIPGEFPPEQCRTIDLARRWGSGIYDLQGCNSQGHYITAARVQVAEELSREEGHFPEYGVPAAARAAPSPPATNGDAGFDKLLQALEVLNRIRPQQPTYGAGSGEDPLRGAMAESLRMMALNQQMQMQSLQAQMAMATAAQAPGKEANSQVFDLLGKLVLAKQTNGAPAGGALGSFGEVLPILQWGMNLGRASAGMPPAPKEDKLPPWAEIAPEIADTVGVPLILTLAQAVLPPDKSRAVIDTIQEHLKARQAEAAAAAANAPDVVETTGEVKA